MPRPSSGRKIPGRIGRALRTREPSEGNDKLVWILLIVLLGFLGALLYFFIRRPQRISQHGK